MLVLVMKPTDLCVVVVSWEDSMDEAANRRNHTGGVLKSYWGPYRFRTCMEHAVTLEGLVQQQPVVEQEQRTELSVWLRKEIEHS